MIFNSVTQNILDFGFLDLCYVYKHFRKNQIVFFPPLCIRRILVF